MREYSTKQKNESRTLDTISNPKAPKQVSIKDKRAQSDILINTISQFRERADQSYMRKNTPFLSGLNILQLGPDKRTGTDHENIFGLVRVVWNASRADLHVSPKGKGASKESLKIEDILRAIQFLRKKLKGEALIFMHPQGSAVQKILMEILAYSFGDEAEIGNAEQFAKARERAPEALSSDKFSPTILPEHEAFFKSMVKRNPKISIKVDALRSDAKPETYGMNPDDFKEKEGPEIDPDQEHQRVEALRSQLFTRIEDAGLQDNVLDTNGKAVARIDGYIKRLREEGTASFTVQFPASNIPLILAGIAKWGKAKPNRTPPPKE